MTFEFTLQELLIFLCCIFGIAAGALTLPVLWNLKKIVGIILPLVEGNQDLFKKTMKKMPEFLDNVGQITGNVRETSDKLKISVPDILQEVECVTSAAKSSIASAGAMLENMGSGINETVAAHKGDTPTYYHILEEIMQIVYRTFSGRK